MSRLIDVLLLTALPASGKSEVRRYLAGLTPEQRAAVELKKAQQVLDRIAARGAIHPNTAARRKSKLARRINALAAEK